MNASDIVAAIITVLAIPSLYLIGRTLVQGAAIGANEYQRQRRQRYKGAARRARPD